MNPLSVIGKTSVVMAGAVAVCLLGACERHTDVYSYDPKVDSVAPPQVAVNTASILEDQKLRPRPVITEPKRETTPASAPAAAGGAGAGAVAVTPEPGGATTTPAAAGAEGAATTAPAVPTAPKTTPPPPIGG
jgi:hypothetical protein